MSDPVDPAMVTLAESLAAVLARPAAEPAAEATATPAEPTPGQAYVQQQQQAATQQAAEQLPEGVMTGAEVEDYERKGDGRHAGMSHAEQMASVDRYIKSAEYHARDEAK